MAFIYKSPLFYVGGDLAYGVVAYAQDRPKALLGLPKPTVEWLRKSGMAPVCYERGGNCIARLSAIAESLPSHKIEVELTPTYFGLAAKAQRYVIIIVPPAS